ncbi:MAG: chitobiase/beta-hexosaminidase C-terminal domain-containing protein, partial [Victivallales bacterium]|jgi:hypothetical protein
MPDGFWSGTWHLPFDRSYAAYANNLDMVFTPLLAAYLEKHDVRYLQQWCGYVDDYLLNYRTDLVRDGIKIPVGPAGAGGPSIGHLSFMILKSPEADKDMPATTFVRFLTNSWTSDLSAIVRSTRKSGANRVMHMYGSLLLDNYVNYPELNCAEYLLKERRRSLETYAHIYMNPDGTGIDYAPNYNKNFITCPGGDYKRLTSMDNPPAWITAEWMREMKENQLRMAKYLIRYFAPNGWMPGYKDATKDFRESTFGPNSFMAKSIPEALEEPDNKLVISALSGGQAGDGKPGFVSESYPYGGYYFMRENWAPDGLFLYFNNFRPGENANLMQNQNISVQAYGQPMLNFFRWESPLLVDGCRQISSATFYNWVSPGYILMQPSVCSYGKWMAHSAWLEPQENRWHTSAEFDFADAALRIPHTEMYPDNSVVYIDDVTHQRQIIFLRKAKAWIVTDRLNARTPHEYQLCWSFQPQIELKPTVKPPQKAAEKGNPAKSAETAKVIGYAREQIAVDGPAGLIRTTSPDLPNLAIFHSGTAPLLLGEGKGQVEQGNDSRFGSAYITGPEFHLDKNGIVASLLYPSLKGNGGAGVKFEKLPGGGASFDVTFPDGIRIFYRSAISSEKLEAAGFSANASMLMVCRDNAGVLTGMSMDCKELSFQGKSAELKTADFEFSVNASGAFTFAPIYRPLLQVEILPEADVFVGEQNITLRHENPDVEIRYTVNGGEPELDSTLYVKPFKITDSSWIRARAFRRGIKAVPPTVDGTLASIVQKAFIQKAGGLLPAMKMNSDKRKQGVDFSYYEDDWSISVIKMPMLKPKSTGHTDRLFDTSVREDSNRSYAFRYYGYIDIPESGVYTFHAPQELFDIKVETGYDLQMWIDGQEWYPATRTQNFGNWSLPLAKGAHKLEVLFLDFRPGDKTINRGFQILPKDWDNSPYLGVSGPGLKKGPIPAAWLFSDVR